MKKEILMRFIPRDTGGYIAAVFAITTILPLVTQAQVPEPFGAVPNARQIEWFHREAQVYLQFGVCTFTGSDWGTGSEDPNVFNPTALDCGQWVRTIKKAGFAGAILVVKFTDGFCSWPSEYTTFDVASSNWRDGKGDVVKEFVDSCRVYGIKPGVYISPIDFHSEKLGNYYQYYVNQTKEVLRNYGKIWEIRWEATSTVNIDSTTIKMLADTVRKLQPQCVIYSTARSRSVTADVRWIGSENGLSTGDPCWATEDIAFSNLIAGVRGGSIYYPAEVISSIRPSWTWHADQDTMVNSVEVLWNKYFQSVGRNATWLLNIPPDNRGLICPTDSMRIDSIGAFIYGTFLAPHANLAEGATVTTNHPRGAGYEPANLVDTAETTYYATPDDIYTDTITFDLGTAKTFDCLMLREVIELGHRTTGWSVDYSSDNSSYSPLLANKQSIGYKWLEKFDEVTARYVRLKITKGQACVALNTFGVYKKQMFNSCMCDVKDNGNCRSGIIQRGITIPVFGRLVELPSSLVGKPFTAELLDLRGRTLAVMRVNAKQALTGSLNSAKVAHCGLYLIKCTGESGVVVRKFMVR